MMRGGSWDWDASFARCAFRYNASPEGGRYDVGLSIDALQQPRRPLHLLSQVHYPDCSGGSRGSGQPDEPAPAPSACPLPGCRAELDQRGAGSE